jgi:hypothetical protein
MTTNQSNRSAKIIFDNGGGITLILADGEFAHYYSHAEQAAQDYSIFMRDGNVDGWDGHEPELADLDPSYDDVHNGGCRMFDPSDVEEAIHSEEEQSWNNIRDFVSAVEASTWK